MLGDYRRGRQQQDGANLGGQEQLRGELSMHVVELT